MTTAAKNRNQNLLGNHSMLRFYLIPLFTCLIICSGCPEATLPLEKVVNVDHASPADALGEVSPPTEVQVPAEMSVPAQAETELDHSVPVPPVVPLKGETPRERLDNLVKYIQTAFTADPVLKPMLSLETKREELDLIGVNLAWQQLEPEVQSLMTNAFGTEQGARLLFTGPQNFRSTNPVLYLAMLHVQGRFKDDVVIEKIVAGTNHYVPDQLDARFLVDGRLGQVDFPEVQAALMASNWDNQLIVDAAYQPESKSSACVVRSEWNHTVLDDTKPSAPCSYKWRVIMTTRKAVEITTGQWEQLGSVDRRLEIVSEFQAMLNDNVETLVYGPLQLTPIGVMPGKKVWNARSTFKMLSAEQEKILSNLEGFPNCSGTLTPAEFLDLSTTFKDILNNVHENLQSTLTKPDSR